MAWEVDGVGEITFPIVKWSFSLVCYNIVNILYVLDYHVGQVCWPKLVFDHI